MKVSELRIGNLLQDKVTKTELKVIRLTENDIVTYVIDRSKFPLQDGWGMEPILLTEEWLLKFGGESIIVEDYPIYFIYPFNIEYYENECIVLIGGFSEIKVKYVHQLQNLYFALTEKELVIKE